MRTPLYICVAISFAYLSLYSIVNHWPMERSVFPLLDIEESIPNLNWTYLIYLSAFAQAVYVIRLIPQKSLVRYMMAPSLALVVGVIFFLLYPVEYPRYLFPDDNFLVSIFRSLDMPGSCFPSLHVSMTILFSYIYSYSIAPAFQIPFSEYHATLK